MTEEFEPAAEHGGGSGALPVRSVALAMLRTILMKGRPLDEVLESDRAWLALPRRDRAFARLIVTTTLRRLGQLDDLIDRCVTRPLPRKAQAVRDVLRIGIAQLLFIGTPPHAAVDTAVELTDEIGYSGFKGLVNAVLRRLSSDGASIVEEQDEVRLAAPTWLWQRWSAAYGEDVTRAIVGAHLQEAPLDITCIGEAGLWAQRLEATLLPTGSIRRPISAGGLISELPGYGSGAWFIQDAAAALPARLFGDLTGRTAIDLCAAPGGKTAQLALAGADVTAVDRAPRRITRLKQNMDRLGLAVATVIADAAEWRAPYQAEAVLLDAPCSATGTLRRHPDIGWLKKPEDISVLSRLQARLLASAARMVSSGGRMVYCVCSLEPEEGPEQIAAFLADNPSFELQPIKPSEVSGRSEFITERGELRTLPCHLAGYGGMDGFYAARLLRVS